MQNIALCVPRFRALFGIPTLLKNNNESSESPKFTENFKKIIRAFNSNQKNDIIIHHIKPVKSI